MEEIANESAPIAVRGSDIFDLKRHRSVFLNKRSDITVFTIRITGIKEAKKLGHVSSWKMDGARHRVDELF